MVAKLFGSGSDWLLVTEWLPFHFLAAGLAWGLREIIHAVRSRGTATSRNSGSPVEPDQSEASSGSEGLYVQTGEPASIDADTDNR